MSIHTLDDDSLLHLFYLYRPPIFDGDEDEGELVTGGRGWDRELWWYKLAHVCQRWRNLIFGSASYLGLCLVCTFGMPIADMLAHSPPFPLVIDYIDDIHDPTAEDEEGITLALEQRDRVRRIRLGIPNLQKLIITMDGDYPVLEYLILSPSDDEVTALMFPDTLQAPRLRQLGLDTFRHSYRISITHDCRGNCRSRSFLDPPFHRLPVPMDFIYAPAGDAYNFL